MFVLVHHKLEDRVFANVRRVSIFYSQDAADKYAVELAGHPLSWSRVTDHKAITDLESSDEYIFSVTEFPDYVTKVLTAMNSDSHAEDNVLNVIGFRDMVGAKAYAHTHNGLPLSHPLVWTQLDARQHVTADVPDGTDRFVYCITIP